jgi:uncharacterized membrane protein
MKKWMIFILLLVSCLGFVSANSYYLEFNQAGDNLLVTEKLDNITTNNYTTPEGLTTSGGDMHFLKKVVFEDNYSNVEIKLNLEKGVFVRNQEIFPVGYKIETDGQSISIIWSLKDINKEEAFAIFVNLEKSSPRNLYIYLIIIIGILILGYFMFLIKREINSNKDLYLLDSEKKVIAILTKAEKRELWQKQIQLATGFSKAKLSRLIRNLESRGLITRIAMGNTNKIKLK